MSGVPFGMIIESVVAILLALTIGYCFVLNKRLKMLHSDRESLREMINDLVQATTLADGAIKQLREVAVETDMTLNARLEEAERFGLELANHVNAGQNVLERISKITSAVRNSGTTASPAPASRVEQAIEALDVRSQQRGRAA
ncbi:MAG TPA: chemotaxis protein [Devosia sp.]|nr:chemotaxis protein [Devosia sp.]